jgi:type IV pilus biogenesis protein CpaD/CtpE
MMRQRPHPAAVLVAAALASLLASCAHATPSPTSHVATYCPADGWRTSAREERGIDSETVAALIEHPRDYDGSHVASPLIIRDGFLMYLPQGS